MEAKPEFGILPRLQWNERSRRIVAFVAVVLAISISASDGGSIGAQDATPAAVACDLEPRPVTFIADLLTLPEPEVTPTLIEDVPDGAEVVDPAVRAAVVRVVEQLILCVNQGEFLRSFSLYDDTYLRRIIDPAGVMTAEVAVEIGKSFDNADPVDPAQVTVLEEVIVVRELPDGLVTIVFRTHGGPEQEAGESQVDLFVLGLVGDRWLIVDGLVDLDVSSIATPTN